MVALFRVNITAPKKLGTFTGELQIHTSFDRVCPGQSSISGFLNQTTVRSTVTHVYTEP